MKTYFAIILSKSGVVSFHLAPLDKKIKDLNSLKKWIIENIHDGARILNSGALDFSASDSIQKGIEKMMVKCRKASPAGLYDDHLETLLKTVFEMGRKSALK